jgi:DNA-binding transcriptional LysR family regulator
MCARRRERKPPSLDALRTLTVVCDEGGVSAAARKLNVSQPVVTKKLAVFFDADACGSILLERNGARLALTEAGETAMPAIRELVRAYDQLLDSLRGNREAPFVLRVATGSFGAQYYLPRALASVAEALEQCEVQTLVLRGEERILGVADGRFDLAIVTHTPSQIRELLNEHRGRHTKLHSERLSAQTICTVARRGTEAARELDDYAKDRPLPVQALGRWDLVGLDGRSGIRQQLEAVAGGPRSVQFIAEGGGWMTAREYARQGLGVAVLPLSVLDLADAKDFVIRRLANQFATDDYLIHGNRDLSAPAKTVKRALQQTAAEREKELNKRWNASV